MNDGDVDRWIETINMALDCDNPACALACVAACCEEIDRGCSPPQEELAEQLCSSDGTVIAEKDESGRWRNV
mgnify:FL=1